MVFLMEKVRGSKRKSVICLRKHLDNPFIKFNDIVCKNITAIHNFQHFQKHTKYVIFHIINIDILGFVSVLKSSLSVSEVTGKLSVLYYVKQHNFFIYDLK